MNKFKMIFKKIKFKLVALVGLLTIGCGCLLSNNSYAWFVNEQGNLESSNLYLNESEETFTQNNVTMRFPSSQSYCYLSGYNDSDTDLFFTWNIFEGLEFGKIYTFSTLSSNSFAYECWYNEGLGGSDIHYITNNGVLTINLTEGLRDNGIWRFVVHPGFDNASLLQLNLMVVEGSTPMAYEPYDKVYYNYQFTSPWKVNAQGNLESSNLFNAFTTEVINDTENNTGISFQFYRNSSKVFIVGNHFTTNKSAYIYYNVFKNLDVGKTYTFSLPSYPYFYYEVLLDSNTHYITSNGVLTLTLTEDLKNYDKWRFVISENISDLFSSFTIMINEGSVPFSYAPYGRVYYSDINLDSLQEQLETFQDKYNLLDANYNELSNNYVNLQSDYSDLQTLNDNKIAKINQLTNDVATLQNLITSLRSQLEDNFGWQNLFFGMADTPFRVVANVLGFDVFGINLFTTFIGLTTTLAVIYLLKRFI